jgi:hypothetical protein
MVEKDWKEEFSSFKCRMVVLVGYGSLSSFSTSHVATIEEGVDALYVIEEQGIPLDLGVYSKLESL